ncbi:MAG TPA: hypothetical protein VNI83_04785, partial [Vicinamibacterales bacterium]|nr:hypothetical protein [Vicinamibacterales bacterium]
GSTGRSTPLAVIGQQVWTDSKRHWLASTYDIPDIRRPGRTSLAARLGLLNFVSPHAKLLRRECWQGLAFEGRVLGDQPWVIRALLRAGDRIEVLGETVYEWHRPRGAAGRASGGSRSITATARGDVQRGLEAMAVARTALEAVEEEARRTDPAHAEAIVRAYVARLLAMDVAPHVGAALTRSDPAVARLFDGTRELLLAIPPERLRASVALARSVVELPLRRWWRLPATARPAYWRLFETALEIDPALPRRGSSPVARLALRLAARGRGAANRAPAAALLMAARLADGAKRLLKGAINRLRGGVPTRP